MTDWVGQSAKYIVLGIAVLSVLFIESPLPVYYVVGGVCNAFLSKILKHIIKQPRPLGSLKGGYGMPSSHSQSIFYFLAVLAIKSCDFIHDTNLWRVFVVSLTLYAYFACSWRISSKLHSFNQTIVGAILGIIGGYIFANVEPEVISIYSDFTGYRGDLFPFWLRLILCVGGSAFIFWDSKRKKKFF